MKKQQAKQPRSLRTIDDAVKTTLVMGISGALFMPLAASAQTAPGAPTAIEAPAAADVASAAAPDMAATPMLPEVVIYGKALDPNPNAEQGSPYKAKTSGDKRHTRPLAETPATISVITKAAIDDAGVTDLKQILAAQPGVTLGTGENGNAFGDRYIIRGQEARSDVFVDGLRDPGMTTRESFAIEQLEISKGANSSFAGRGTAGGAINAITKQAMVHKDFTHVSVGAGSDDHKRVTADVNKGFGESFALRANLLYGDEGVPDRAPSERSRKGIALSGLFEADKDLNVTLDYYGLRAKDTMPDLGHFLTGTVPNRVPAKDVPVYAQKGDFASSDVDTVTARVNWRINPSLALVSLTRYGKSKNAYVNTGANAGTRYDAATNTPYSTIVLDGGHTGWQDVDYFAHQSNLRLDQTLWGKKHTFIFGAEYTDHQVVSGNFGVTNATPFNCKSTATAAAANNLCWTNLAGANNYTDLSTFAGRSTERRSWNQDWQVKTVSLTAMDTVDLTDRFTAFAGLRADHFDLDLVRRNNLTDVVTGTYGYNDTLVNGHFGLTYKITPKLMVYGSGATAQDINGGEADAGTSSGYGGAVLYENQIAGARPETSVNLELGAKWNLFNDQLLATAAVFQNKKKDVMEGANYDTVGTFNTGGNRVRGIEMAIAGNVTDKLSAQVGGSVMRSRVTDSATPGFIGRPLSNFANKSFSAQGRYQLTNAFAFGAIARYESERCGGQPDTGAGIDAAGLCQQPVPSFSVYDLFAEYRFSKKLDLRVNVINATNKDYFTAVYRSGAFLYKGDARAVRVTLNYEI